LITTVGDNEADHSTRKVKAAQIASILSRRLDYATPRDLHKIIKNSTLFSFPVTTANIVREEMIYGKDITALKGKSTRRASTPVSHICLELGLFHLIFLKLIILKNKVLL